MNDEPSAMRPGLPVTDFWGVLLPLQKVERTSTPEPGSNQKPRTTVSYPFKFTNIEIIATEEPWPFTTLEFSINYTDPTTTNRRQTRWEAAASSLRKVLMDGGMSIDQIKWSTIYGKRQHWKLIDFEIPTQNQETKQWENVPTPCWQLVEVQGIGSSAGQDDLKAVLGIVNGKTPAEVYAAILENPGAYSPTVVNSATNRGTTANGTMIDNMVTAGFITIGDDGKIATTGKTE